MSELLLRPATPADLDQIWALEAAVFGSEAWSREMMREELEADHRSYLVLVDGAGAVAGYGGLLAVGAEGDIQTIALAPTARGEGQGRRLMDALLDAGAERGVREVFLEVRADNPVARGLYASLGFAEIGVRPRYYQPDDVDAVVMRLEISGRPARSRRISLVEDADSATRELAQNDGGRGRDEGERGRDDEESSDEHR